MIRTPWPSRSAPHHWIACQIDGRPKASPAWMVKWAFSRWRYSNASRWRVGGKPASAPAMSKPATPRSRQAMASSAISIERAWWRIAVSSWRTTIRRRWRPSPASKPSWTAATTSSRVRPLVDVLLGGVADLGVDDAVGGQVLDALAGDPGDGRAGLHHGDGVVEGLEVAHQRAGVGRLDEPAAQRLRVGGRELVADLGGELDDRLRPQPTVEVVVQQDLGRRGAPARGWAGQGWPTSRAQPSSAILSQPMRTFTTLDEVAAAAGSEIGTSEWLDVDQERINPFADATGDHQWIHVDVERRRPGRSARTIAHGFLTLSLLPYFAREVFAPRDPGRPAQLRAEQGALPSPVPVDSRLRSHVSLRRGHRPAGRQAADHQAHGRDRGPRQAGLRGRAVVLLLA